MNTFNQKRTSLGYSQTRSSVLRASRFNKSDENNHAKCLAPPPPPPKNAKVAAPMRRGADCENISTLDTLLGYMENYPKVPSSAFGAIGKPGKKDATGASATTSLPAPKPVKPAGLLGTKSSADMPGLSLPGYQASSCIVMSQKGVDKPQDKVDQEQQTAKAEQQQKLLDGSIAGDVKSGRGIKEPGTKRTAVIGKRSGNEVQELNPAVETDKAKPTSGQKRPLSFYDIRIPKKARGEQRQPANKCPEPARCPNNPQPRRQPASKCPAPARDPDKPQKQQRQLVNRRPAPARDSEEPQQKHQQQQQPANKRPAPARDSDEPQTKTRLVNKRPAPLGYPDEAQQQQQHQEPTIKRARILPKPVQNGGDTAYAPSSSTLCSSPLASDSDSRPSPPPCKSTGLTASSRRQAVLLVDVRKVRERQSKNLSEAQRLIQSSAQPKTRPAKRGGKTAVDIDKPTTKIMWNPCLYYTSVSGYTGGCLPAEEVYRLHKEVGSLDKPKRPAKRKGAARQPRKLY